MPCNAKWFGVFMLPLEARVHKLEYFHMFCTEEVVEQVEGFIGITRSELTL